MNWNELKEITELDKLDMESEEKYILIYKHSTRCGICVTVKNELEENWLPENEGVLKPYYLDLLRYRAVSDEIAKRYDIKHQSPQILLIKNKACVYSESQFAIDLHKIMKVLDHTV